jgi:hypothetical protein
VADRGRDLGVKVLSDVSQFDLSKPADQLDDVAAAAAAMVDDTDKATDELKRLATQGADAQRALDKLSQEARDNDLDRVGTDAKTTATKVDGAFDAIARSSRSAAGKVDDGTDRMRGSLRDVRDEAGSTAREAAASFGSTGDIGDALQELSANAPAALGPLGLAFGAVAGIGVGLFRAKTEALKQRVDDLVDAMIAAGGKISEATITDSLSELAKDGTLKGLKDIANDAGQSFVDLARARAGDADAAERGMRAARKVEKSLLDQADAGKVLSADEEIRLRATRDYIQAMSEGSEAIDLAREATGLYSTATGKAGDSLDQAKIASRELRGELSEPIVANVRVNAPTRAYLNGVAADLADGIGPIIVDVVTNPRTDLFYPNRRKVT